MRALTLFLAVITLQQLQIFGHLQHYHRNHDISKRSTGEDRKVTNTWVKKDWNDLAKQAITKSTTNMANIKKNAAKNVIMFLGDGMGHSTVAAARLFKAEFKKAAGTNSYLAWENFPFVGLARTFSVDRSTTDSAASATAYLTGIKANYQTIGVNENVLLRNCTNIKDNKVKSTLHKSIEAGKWTGVVTTTRITHASPAGCYASTANRDWENKIDADAVDGQNCKDIASQLIEDDRNQDIRVLFGGGAANFLPKYIETNNTYTNNTSNEFGNTEKTGLREDGKNLIEEWIRRRKTKNQAHKVLRTKDDLDNLNTDKNDYVLGLFNEDHLEYEIDKEINRTEPTLVEMTRKAIDILKRSKDGYFLFVEGGRIDHAHHDTNAYRSLHETLAMEAAVEAAKKATDPEDTLIVVTADHSHVFTLGGYGSHEESVLGFANAKTVDEMPLLQLMYANGPGYKFHRNTTTFGFRANLTGVDTHDKDFTQDTAVWTNSETHGGEDVPVYASGPWSHLFHTTEEQSYVAHVMMYASCVGDYTTEAHCVSSAEDFKKNYLNNVIMMVTVILISISFN